MKTTETSLILFLILSLFVVLSSAGTAGDSGGTKTTEIVYKAYGAGQNLFYGEDTIYLIRNTPYLLGAVKAEVSTTAVNIPPEYRTPETKDYYKEVEEEFPIDGTVKLKIYRGNVLLKELDEQKTGSEDVEKRFEVSLDEGEYVFKLNALGSDLMNSERNVKVIREKSQDVAYEFGFQRSESPADTVYMTKGNDVNVRFEIRKEIDKEYFDKIGVNTVMNDRGFLYVELGSEMLLELSGGGETKQYTVEKSEGDWRYNVGYVINIKDKGNYNIRLVNKDTGKVLEGSERTIRVIDAKGSFIPFLLALIPISAGIAILVLRRRGNKIGN